MVTRLTLRRALLGREVAVVFGIIAALYLPRFVRIQPLQIPTYLLIVAYDVLEVAIPFLTPYYPVAFPVFLYLLAIVGVLRPDGSELPTAKLERRNERPAAFACSSASSRSCLARPSVARSSLRLTTRHRWRSPARLGSGCSSSAGGYSDGRWDCSVAQSEQVPQSSILSVSRTSRPGLSTRRSEGQPQRGFRCRRPNEGAAPGQRL